jgi:VanZ family protein
MKEFVKRWGPALAWMAFIFIGSMVPAYDLPHYQGGWDFVVKKTGHLLEYSLLALLVLRALSNQGLGSLFSADELPGWPQIVSVLAIVALYAATDEFHQRFTVGRGGKLVDVAIDIGCGGLGLACLYGWRLIRQTRTQSPPSHSTRPQP